LISTDALNIYKSQNDLGPTEDCNLQLYKTRVATSIQHSTVSGIQSHCHTT